MLMIGLSAAAGRRKAATPTVNQHGSPSTIRGAPSSLARWQSAKSTSPHQRYHPQPELDRKCSCHRTSLRKMPNSHTETGNQQRSGESVNQTWADPSDFTSA
jgi:hypothetical protein